MQISVFISLSAHVLCSQARQRLACRERYVPGIMFGKKSSCWGQNFLQILAANQWSVLLNLPHFNQASMLLVMFKRSLTHISEHPASSSLSPLRIQRRGVSAEPKRRGLELRDKTREKTYNQLRDIF